MVLVAGMVAALIALALVPDENSQPLAERALVITVIVSAGALGIFLLGFFSTRATRRGCYVGIGAGVVFTLWAVLTEPAARWIDLGPLNFEMNAILIGIIGNGVTFGVGWLASVLLGGYRPEDAAELRLFGSGRNPGGK
jgi:SSS family solute:Na+ symporter